MRKPIFIAFSAVILLLVSASTYALAHSKAPSRRGRAVASVIRACESRATGALYIRPRCVRGYKAVVWDVQGRPGRNGRNGQNGRPGAGGQPGAPGQAATVSVGGTTTGGVGSPALVTNTGSSQAAKLNFTLPQGPAGPAGPQGPTGARGAQGPTGQTGAAGTAGTAPWSTPVTLTNGQNDAVNACPYKPSTGTTAGTPATAINFNGSTYEYTGTGCKTASTSISGPNFNTDTPDVDPSDWSLISAAGANGTANAWAVIDPGTCANGGNCNGDTLAQGGVPGAGVSFTYHSKGFYELTVTGCTAADTPAAGKPFPAAISITPEAEQVGESGNDTTYIPLIGDAEAPTSDGVLGGLGVIDFYVYLGIPDNTTFGTMDGLDAPFSVMVDC